MTSYTRRITYFGGEGRDNLPEVLRLVAARMQRDEISKAVTFSTDGDVAIRLRELLPSSKTVIAVTFPATTQFRDAETGTYFSHGLADASRREVLRNLGIPVVIGTMPLQEIVIPRAEDPKLAGIRYALRLFGGGTDLCIQAVMMAVDGGAVSPGDRIIVFTSDTALVVRAASSAWLFHPREGLEVQEIICKPSSLTISRPEPEEEDD